MFNWSHYGYTRKDAEHRLMTDPRLKSHLRIYLNGIEDQQQYRLMTRLQERITGLSVRWKGSPVNCVATCVHVGLSNIAVHLANGTLEWWMHGAYTITDEQPHGCVRVRVITCTDEEDARRYAENGGCDVYLLKPGCSHSVLYYREPRS